MRQKANRKGMPRWAGTTQWSREWSRKSVVFATNIVRKRGTRQYRDGFGWPNQPIHIKVKAPGIANTGFRVENLVRCDNWR